MPGFEERPPQGPRRTKSLPSKYMIPAADMGEYENGDPNRRRSAPPQSKPPGLYPLDEEGSYGEAPRRPGIPPPSPVPFARIRERKTKTYSSYAVDSDCEMHAEKLAAQERKTSEVRKLSCGSRPVSRSGSISGRNSVSRAGSRPVSRAGSISGRNSVSGSPAPSRRSFSGYDNASRSRASSSGRSSRSPEPSQQNGDVVYSGGMPYRKKSSGGTMYPAGQKKSSQSWQNSLRSCDSPSATSSNANARRRSRSSFSNQFRDLRESSFEENEEYEYAENQRSMSTVSRQQKSSTMSNGYSSSSSTNAYSSFTKSYQNGIGGGGNTAVSLDGLRKPKIDSWDSMGILGLTTKIWNDTKKRQETFLESTGHFLREETSSYIM